MTDTNALDKAKVFAAFDSMIYGARPVDSGKALKDLKGWIEAGEFDLPPTVDLSSVDTAELVAALKGREGVETMPTTWLVCQTGPGTVLFVPKEASE